MLHNALATMPCSPDDIGTQANYSKACGVTAATAATTAVNVVTGCCRLKGVTVTGPAFVLVHSSAVSARGQPRMHRMLSCCN